MRSGEIGVVDVGNTSISVGTATIESGEPKYVASWPSDAAEFHQLLSDEEHSLDRITDWYVASVCQPASDRLSQSIKSLKADCRIVELTTRHCPIGVDVEFPDKVGVDRVLGAVAANRLRDSNKPAIVVDAGSAITVDAVSCDGTFLGGVIMAGFAMRTEALAQNTDLLPLIHSTGADNAPPVIGKSTEEAIRSGIYWGTVGSIREVIARTEEELGGAEVFVTGGDMIRMAGHLRSDAKFVPNLVLTGITLTAQQLADG